MSHNSADLTIKQNTPIAAPLDCQPTASWRKSPASPFLGHLLTPPGTLSWPNTGSNWSRRPSDSWPDARSVAAGVPVGPGKNRAGRPASSAGKSPARQDAREKTRDYKV